MIKENVNYRDRWDAVSSSLGKQNAVVVLASGEKRYRNGDVEYAFRAESYFYYLCGLCEPDMHWVLQQFEDGRYTVHVFCEDFNESKARWVGRSWSHAEYKQRLGAVEVHLNTDVARWCQQHISSSHTVYTLPSTLWSTRMQRDLSVQPSQLDQVKVYALLMRMRQVKDEFELKHIQKSCDYACVAFEKTYQALKEGRVGTESELYAEYRYHCMRQGVLEEPYPAIVADGANATVLHYTDNNKALTLGSCILLDAGCESAYYASDITRVWPVSGRFTEAQKAVYEGVLSCQKVLINAIKPGVTHAEIQKLCCKELCRVLIELGVLQGSVESCLKSEAYKHYFMHGWGHQLGLDVHDPHTLSEHDKSSLELKEGMVVTVEPGLYFSKDDASIAKEFRGLGIRIEDNVYVSATGSSVLTASLRKEVKDIEWA